MFLYIRFKLALVVFLIASLVVGLSFLFSTSEMILPPFQIRNHGWKLYNLPKLIPIELIALSIPIADSLTTNEERSLIVKSLKYFNYNGSFLIWGTGKDTPFWEKVNFGRNTFLENDPKWVEFGNKHSNDVQQVWYRTQNSDYKTYEPTDQSLGMVLSGDVMKVSWDVIFVDSPVGWGTGPGRMQSIYMSSKLANNRTHICIHDFNREAESFWGEKMFGKSHKKKCCERMCCYFPQNIILH